jgi:hypothetical protein
MLTSSVVTQDKHLKVCSHKSSSLTPQDVLTSSLSPLKVCPHKSSITSIQPDHFMLFAPRFY